MTEVERLTVPVKPEMLVRVRVALAGLPTCIIIKVELDENEKSPTPTIIVVVCESGLLVSVRMTVYVPSVDEMKVQTEPVELPEDKVTLVGEQKTTSPIDGFTDSVRSIVPANPPRLVKVTVEVPFAPDWKPTVAGLAEAEKSTTVIVI